MGSSGETCAFPGCDGESEQDGAYCATCASATTESGDGGEVTEAQPTTGGRRGTRESNSAARTLVFGIAAGLGYFGSAHAADFLGVGSKAMFAFEGHSLLVSTLIFVGLMLLIRWVT